ncbi:hypothetical protein K490DRAFT_54840 [Saccharata proteae CBS 121410]|uniref:EthD domain-containing protein n=1 Tax=Saccharata proteae CBS 121410 TaxID=1314787 RepID=A0A6A5YEI9_9PEZI|nr:hypothetical protein K490DRAFT_54840 [Saccharata proteae CBS 121410]
MAITELIFPSIKPEPAIRDAFDKYFPAALQQFGSESGVTATHLGRILREDGLDIEAERRILLAFEWQGPESFDGFLDSEQFEAFKAGVYEYLAAPAAPQLYASENRSVECLKSPITQVFKVEGDTSEEERKNAWDEFVAAVDAKSGKDVKSFSAVGMRSFEGVFMGMIGWESLELLEEVCDSEAF